MKLHLKLLLCFLLVSVALPLIAYISILNPRIRHAAQFVEESHQEILSEYRLSIQLQIIDRCLQEIEIEALRPQHEETARGQLGRATGELYSTLVAFKEHSRSYNPSYCLNNATAKTSSRLAVRSIMVYLFPVMRRFESNRAETRW
jgi:hypothetical protein